MDDIAKTWLVSVPLGDQGRMAMVETLEDLCSTSSGQTAIVSDFAIPSFKIGNLDALINQGEALAKLDAQCTASTNKIADIVRTILMGDEARVEEQLMVNDSMFKNVSKPRADRRRHTGSVSPNFPMEHEKVPCGQVSERAHG